MMRRTAIAIHAAALLLLPSHVRAQDLTSDRPDFTESVVVVNRPQLETGYTFTRAAGIDRHDVGEFLLRLGLTPRFELRLGANSYVHTRDHGVNTNAIEDAAIGFKLGLSTGAAIIVTAGLPTGSDAETADGVVPDILLALQQSVSETVGLGSNVSIASVPGPAGRHAAASGSLVVGFDAGARTGLFLETYGTRILGGGDVPRDHSLYADGGVTRSLSADLQLDARVGRRLNGTSEWFFGIGVVRRW